MNFEQNDPYGETQPQEPGSPLTPPNYTQPGPKAARTPRKRTGWRVFWAVVLVLSVLANIVLFLMLIGLATLFAVGHERILTEEVIQKGPRATKIAVVRLQGVIDDNQRRQVKRQLKAARQDRAVKGIILRVNSPGGTISASDEIYHQIRDKTEKPVVAFMQGLAASGGYYTSVACDTIVAEPTVITGSIGVIAGWFVIQDLLEQKLGIEPVIVKSGEKKDWPSSFRKASEQEIQYLQEKLIIPAYNRFVDIVAEGRKDSITANEVRNLADGSIYGAQEALDLKLVDHIGYFDEALNQVKSLAGITEAQVVQYRKPFSFSEFLTSGARQSMKIERNLVYELGTPQVLYLWTGY